MLCARDQDFVRRFIAGETRIRMQEFCIEAAKRAFLEGHNMGGIRYAINSAMIDSESVINEIRERRKAA